MGWGLDKAKVRSQWDEWTRFTQMARGDQPAGLDDMFGRPFQTPAAGRDTSSGDDLLGPAPDTSPGDQPFVLDPVGSPEQKYALTMLAHLAEMGVLSWREFQVLRTRVTGV